MQTFTLLSNKVRPYALRIFLIAYIGLLVPHLIESFEHLSWLLIVGSLIGISIAAFGHIEKIGNYGWITPLFLAIHMIVELGHFVHHGHGIALFAIHIIFDIALLWILAHRNIRSFSIWIVIILTMMAITLPLHLEIHTDIISGLVMGGIVTCVLIHLWRGH